MPETQEPFVGEDGKSEQKRIAQGFNATEYDMVSTLHAGDVTVSFHADGRVTGRHGREPREAAQAILNLGASFGPSSPWLDISTAPKDGTLIDVWVNGERRAGVKWGVFEPRSLSGTIETWLYEDHQGYWVPLVGANAVDEVTHYMPLPAPPEAT